MTFQLRFRPDVVADLRDAERWYDECRSGLGIDFLKECRDALDRITRRPEQRAANELGIRSYQLRRFPYLIHYRIERQSIIVFAVMFAGRDPSAWERRT